MRRTWDQAKNRANLRAHSLSFEAAVFVFDNPMSATREDLYPYEQRQRAIGMVGTQIVMVVHTCPALTRRPTKRRERDAYEEGHI